MRNKITKYNSGFSLIEVLTVIVIASVLSFVTVLSFYVFRNKSELDNATSRVVKTLVFAQNKTLASEGASQYGVFFDDTLASHQYTLFKGPSFAARDPSSDLVYKLPGSLEFFTVNLSGGKEVVFEKITGFTGQPGLFSIRLRGDPLQIRTIYIEGLGQVGLNPPSLLSGGIQDSRRVRFDYQRIIDTNTEVLSLVFPGKTQQIPLSLNLENGQIYWEGDIIVDDVIQKITVHTLRLNNPDTEFCVHRDKRYNNKSIEITLSEDATGSLIIYPWDGSTTISTSIYVSNIIWQ